MEGLKLRCYIVGALFLAAGAIIALAPAAKFAGKTEDWMETHTPFDFGGYAMVRTPDHRQCTYKVADINYTELDPYGIVAKVYQKEGMAFDVLVIASQDRKSFHDQRVCLSAQGWSIMDQEERIVKTRTRGDVPVSLTRLESQGTKRSSVLFYRGQDRFYAAPVQLKLGMFFERLKGGSSVDGVFYRIMPSNQDSTEAELLQFVAEYLDEAAKTSDGYF